VSGACGRIGAELSWVQGQSPFSRLLPNWR